MWTSLETIGIGAIPLLPGTEAYLAEWIRAVLGKGGWALADSVIPHRAEERAWSWKIAASEPVLIGVLRGRNEAEHLEWIEREKTYYMRMLKSQQRQFSVKWLAVYVPTALRRPGAVTRVAEVEAIEIMPRNQIQTPWQARNADETQVVYRLGQFLDLPDSIENRGTDGEGSRVSTPRWTSKLALGRACEMKELLLETEPEWRFYEGLRSSGIPFVTDASGPTTMDSQDPRGRAWFRVGEKSIQYRGAAGFLVRAGTMDRYVARVSDLIEMCC